MILNEWLYHLSLLIVIGTRLQYFCCFFSLHPDNDQSYTFYNFYIWLESWIFADGSLLLASGGDDNALTIHRLTLTSAGKGTGSMDTLTRADTGTCSMNTSTFASTGAGIGSADTLTHGKTSPGNESATADCLHRSSVLEVVSVITKTDAHAAQITGTVISSFYLPLWGWWVGVRGGDI